MVLHGYAALLGVFPLFSLVITRFLWSLPILVSDYLLPQQSNHLSSVFALLVVTLAKLKVTNEIRYLSSMCKIKHTHLKRETVLRPLFNEVKCMGLRSFIQQILIKSTHCILAQVERLDHGQNSLQA